MLALLLLLAAPEPAIVVVPPGPVLAGTPISLKLAGFPPDGEVTVRAERVVGGDGKPQRYRAEAAFKTDPTGGLDLATAVPQRGSYQRADPRGLFWSMAPVGPAGAGDEQGVVRLTAGPATAVVRLLRALPEVATEKVPAFPGAVFASLPTPAGTRRPGVILLGGSEGGSGITAAAAPLASHGFAVLALPYYSPPQWPAEDRELPVLPAAFADVPVERLTAARDWLAARPGVDGDRVGVHGTSKGAEYALLAGVHLPWVKAVVAVVPTDVVWEGWGPGVEAGKRSSFALNGKPLPFVPYRGFADELRGFQTGEPVRFRRPHDRGRAAAPAAAVAARIPAERIPCPVAVVGGHDDQIWASGMMAQNVAERRAAAGLDTLALIYPDAGHLLGGTGDSPTTQYDAGPGKAGGTPEANAAAQADAYPQLVRFLRRTLGQD